LNAAANPIECECAVLMNLVGREWWPWLRTQLTQLLSGVGTGLCVEAATELRSESAA
jgi:hypothetical protein